MVDNLMRERGTQVLIGHESIAVNSAANDDVLIDLAMKRFLAPIRNYSSANFSTAFQDSYDGGFVVNTPRLNPALVNIFVHESGSATNESFVYFDMLSVTTQFDYAPTLQRKAQAMQNEPSGFLCDAQIAPNLVRANTVFAVHQKPKR